MKIVNRLIILIIVFNFLVLIGAGHGIAFLGLIEISEFREYLQSEVKFKLSGSYEDRLFASATLAFVGKIILVIALFLKEELAKFKTIYVGLFILLLSFIILTEDILDSNLDSFSFWSGIPFLALTILLLIRTIKNHKSNLTKIKYSR